MPDLPVWVGILPCKPLICLLNNFGTAELTPARWQVILSEDKTSKIDLLPPLPMCFAADLESQCFVHGFCLKHIQISTIAAKHISEPCLVGDRFTAIVLSCGES
jgi:hypothetical protein